MLAEPKKLFQPDRFVTDTLSIYLALVGIPETSFSFLLNLFSTDNSSLTDMLAEPQLTSKTRPLSFIVMTSSNSKIIFYNFLAS